MAERIINATVPSSSFSYIVGGGRQYFNYYIKYSELSSTGQSINPSTLQTTLVYQKPGPFNTIQYVEAAKLQADGTWKTLKENEARVINPPSSGNPNGSFGNVLNSNSSNYVLGDATRKELAAPGPNTLNYAARQNAVATVEKATDLTRNQIDQAFGISQSTTATGTQVPAIISNREPADDPTVPVLPPPASGEPDPPPPPADSINLSEYTVPYNDPNFEKNTDFGTFAYPNGTGTIGLDFLKIEILKYNKTEANAAKTGLAAKTYSPVSEKGGTIYLGLQASITDQNTVGWTDDSIDPLKLGTNLNALGLIEGTTGFNDVVETIEKQFSDPTVQKFVKSVAAKATNPSDSNLFGRITNSIVNPNMELLFNRPNLRPFNFTFKMVPRDEKELESVKGIIKALKQSSAVQIGSGELFLKTPFVYRLSYMTQKGSEAPKLHPSLNKIKECALTSISVDYTPSNVYMTYNDDNATMTAYTMQLQFSELIPVYADDYLKENHAIGY